MNWVIPSPDQILIMENVMDYIFTNKTESVDKIREKFNLPRDAYNMIYDPTMPHIRMYNADNYWKMKYMTQRDEIIRCIRNYKTESKLKRDIWRILEDCDIGENNRTMRESLKDYEQMEDSDGTDLEV